MHPVVAASNDTNPQAGKPAVARQRRPFAARLLRPRSPAFAFFCAYAFFVIYGTLLPFQFITDPALIRDRWSWINWNPLVLVTGEATPIADIVVNIAFFMPLGFIGFHAQRRRSPASAILRCTLAGLALSATVEAMQYFTPSRNPATSDVLTNMLGALLGAMCAAFFRREVEGALARRAAAWTTREPLLLVLAGYVAVVGMAALVPFDLSCSVSELRHALRAAQLHLAGTPAQWTAACVHGLRFAVLAGLSLHVLTRVRRGSRLTHAVLCVLGGSMLAVGLELGQLLVRSHVFATRDLCAGAVGSAAGVLVGLLLEATGRAGWGWGLVAVTYALGIVAEALVPFGFRFDLESMLSRVTYTALIPYSSYYFKANVAAVADLLDGLLTWLPFAFVLARLRSDGRRPVLREGLAVIAWCAVLALGVELLQLGVPRRYPEISDVLTAALGAGLGAYAWSWCAHLAADLAAARRAALLAIQSVAPHRPSTLPESVRAWAEAAPTARASS